MWMAHHLWHQNITFFQLSHDVFISTELESHSLIGVFISLMILITAAAKSAQLPFSSWLPRAMEGPTPSSAIFYGSLSVHFGVFLLLRTFQIWEHQFSVRVVITILGLSTAIVSTLIARVQSSVKSQIAYSSIAQIGLIFIEIALGLEEIALIHIAGNAFLRTYQLLVSPSVVSYKIREQFYEFVPRMKTIEDTWPKKFEYALYILSLKEWNLDSMLYSLLWNPLKKLGSGLKILNFKYVFYFAGGTVLIGLILLFFGDDIPAKYRHSLPVFFAVVGFLIVIKAFTERDSVRKSWSLIALNHLTIAIAISFNEHFDYVHHVWYLSGIAVAYLLGMYLLNRLRREEWVSLDQFYGHSYEHPKLAILFLLCCLGLAGFPITPSFIGEDLIFSHIHYNQIGLAFFIALSLIINGLATIRIYARVFLGPHIKTYHEVAKRSS
jgi:formate hydrogenlyase subunit 3/multisubunit Na+/H+ antiporter MnhD subunit